MENKTVKWATKRDLIAYILDGMSSNGTDEDAEKMTELVLEREYVKLEWDGYYLVKSVKLEEDFFSLWDEVLEGN